jgi:hypothetical protein
MISAGPGSAGSIAATALSSPPLIFHNGVRGVAINVIVVDDTIVRG